ncbi:MAG TPA: tyrosine-type recombinase/integrase [Pyrinomonadaceae bacterium]|nr:tyrosine-type recombinase/integrase [Pyrinomonadaceae bacterium]
MAGQIIKKKDKTWLVRIFLGRDTNGKRKYFGKIIHGTKKNAETYLNAKLREKDLGVFVEPASMPLSEFLDRWLEEIAKPRVRKSTFASYEMMLRLYVKPRLGTKRLSDVEAHEIQKVYNEMRKSGLSSRTVRYAHNVLSSAFKQAIKWQMLVRNPCDVCVLPRLEKSEMKYFMPDEVSRFLAVAREDKHFLVFHLALETGMRPEEYLAVQWKDIDLETGILSVRRALIWNRTGGGFRFEEPKTSKSRRSIPLSDTVVTALKNYRRTQLEQRMRLGGDYANLDLVFATELGTPISSKNLRDRHFKPLMKKAGLAEIRLYDLRHTTATLLLSAGENPKVVSERLGHASIVLTLDTYSHVLPTMQKEATSKIEKLMFGT